MKLSAPAKVNLSLKIQGKREDGFHEIETLMVPISIADELEVVVGEGEGVVIRCDDPTVPAGPENLAAKAVAEFARHTGLKFRAEITIAKRIPHGAGLGGGSSDAAAVLLALDALLRTNLGTEVLERIGSEIGSDVPFFVGRRPAWARGRGERIEAAEWASDKELFLVLIKPTFGVETPWAYQAWSGSREIPGVSLAEQVADGLTLVNDLERPVFEKFILLPVIKQWLLEQAGVKAALMSGSGSTMFAVCESRERADEVARSAREKFGEEPWIAVAGRWTKPKPSIGEFLQSRLDDGGFVIGQIAVEPGLSLRHVDDREAGGLKAYSRPTDALELAKYDPAGAYRPLKTAPNLARGWELKLDSLNDLRLALDFFYPAAVGTWLAFLRGEVASVPLRETLGRQTGMYRVTRLMNDEQADELNRTACNSETGCLRRVMWPLDVGRDVPLTESVDAVRAAEGTGEIPILCVEACNLLVAAARPLGKANLPPKE